MGHPARIVRAVRCALGDNRPCGRIRGSAQAGGMRSQLTIPAPPSPLETFDPDDLRGLPVAARRWLSHAITPGAVLSAGIEMHMHGEIRIGRWRRFIARQTLVPGRGFVWSARTRVAGVPISGYDQYADGFGRMLWQAFGLIPVRRADGFDVTASAADRLAAESVLVPPTLVRATWLPTAERDSATLIDTGTHGRHPPVIVRVDPAGRLLGVSLQRWGNPDGGKFGLHRFDVHFGAEYDAGEFRTGDRMRAAWVDGEGVRNEFYRAEIDSVRAIGPAVDG